MTDYRTYILWIAAFILALIAFLVSRKWDFALKRSAASRLVKHANTDKRDMADRLGDVLVARLGLSLKSWQFELRWAQIGGYYQTKIDKDHIYYKTVGSVMGQCVLFGGIGLVYIILLNAWSPLYLIGAALLAYYPFVTLRGKAGTVRDQVKRMLPEAAALISAEMNANGSLDQSVRRAAELPGALGGLIKEAVKRADDSGRLVFSRQGVEGVMAAHFAELKFSPLETFANRMDTIAAKGTDGPRRMSDLARDLAVQYQVVVAQAAETLDSKLLMPMTVFFFIPFMAAVFIPLMVSVFQVF